jgi:hypothetical protein
MTDDNMDLRDLLEKTADADLLRKAECFAESAGGLANCSRCAVNAFAADG